MHMSYNDLDHARSEPAVKEVLSRICIPGIVQILPRKTLPDHADYTPTRQYMLDHAYRTGTYLPCLADLGDELYCCTALVGIDDTDHLFEV